MREYQDPFMEFSTVWNTETGEYGGYHIPGIAATKKDTLLAFIEARRAKSDWAAIDILIIRSTDKGKTWSAPVLVLDGTTDGVTMNNPVMIVGNDGIIHLIYCCEYAIEGHDVYYRRSEDDGITWSEPKVITYATKEEYRNAFATGPGHSICTPDGTLIVPVWMVPKKAGAPVHSHYPSEAAVLYSRDNGETWEITENLKAEEGIDSPNEATCAVLSDGSILFNIRCVNAGYRAMMRSKTGYSGFSEIRLNQELICPTCHGSTILYHHEGHPDTLLFVNPESPDKRENLVIKGSLDGGVTWPIRRVITTGSASYSDIAVDSTGRIYILYVDAEISKATLVQFDFPVLLYR